MNGKYGVPTDLPIPKYLHNYDVNYLHIRYYTYLSRKRTLNVNRISTTFFDTHSY